MGGTVIVTVRPGVQFTPDAAKAFQRAEAQVQAEFGRNIDVNSTYRDWNEQLRMFNAWQAYLAGGPNPGHSKALHPDDPLAFHTKGTALDSDDWVNARIVAILAENGFIRNRLYVPNEKHHFEYIRSEDKNYGKEIDMPLDANDLRKIRQAVWNDHTFQPYLAKEDFGMPAESAGMRLRRVTERAGRSLVVDRENRAELAALTAAVEALAKANGADPAAILKAVRDGVSKAMDGLTLTIDAG